MNSTNPEDRNQPLLQLAVLISGSGRTLVNLQHCIQTGTLAARIEIVVCSRGDVVGVTRSRDLGLPTVVIERKNLTPTVFQEAITDAVSGVDLVCMAGFLSLWRIPAEFAGRVINIHPALLPDFGGPGMYGLKVHQAVLAAGRKETGCTVHFCDNEYDHGPIIVQRRIPVFPNETPESLAERVFREECIAYPQAIQQIACGEIDS